MFSSCRFGKGYLSGYFYSMLRANIDDVYKRLGLHPEQVSGCSNHGGPSKSSYESESFQAGFNHDSGILSSCIISG
jgi:hypothetical protein